MHRKAIKLGGRLTGVAIAPSARPHLAPAPPPPIAPPPPVLPDPPELPALRRMLAEFDAVLKNFRGQQQATIESIAEKAVEIGVALAERLLNSEIAQDRQRLDRVLWQSLERMQPAKAITVRGHADDLALLQRQLAEHDELANVQSALAFRTEACCERGQMKIEADDWFVEFDTQRSLAELHDRLLEEIHAHE